MKTDGEGVYILIGRYIALRDNNTALWKLNLTTANPDGSLTMHQIGEFRYLWQVHEYITHHPF